MIRTLAFILRMFTENMGLKFVATAISVVLWIIVLASKTEVISKEIPLEVLTSEDVIPSNELPRTVAVQLSGPKAFLRAVMDRKEKPININLANRKTGYVTYRFFADNLQLPIGVKVVSFNPPSVVIQLDKLGSKQVPVRVQIQGEVPEGFQLGKVLIVPDKATITGAKSKLVRIAELQTLPLDVGELRATHEEEARLALPFDGIRVEDPQPQIKVEVNAVTANYKIRNVPITVSSKRKHELSSTSVTVFIRASNSQLKELDPSKVFAQVELLNLPPGKYDRPVHVTVPEGVGVVKVIPDQVKVTLY